MSFVISIDKFTGSCNVLSPKIYAQKKKKKKKYIKTFNTFNLIANKNGPKIMTKYISYNCK